MLYQKILFECMKFFAKFSSPQSVNLKFSSLMCCRETIRTVIIIIKLNRQHGFPWLALTICPYHPLLLADPPNYIQCLLKAGISWRTSLMSSSLLFQQYPTCLTWMVHEIGGKRLYSCCFVGCCIKYLFEKAHIILVQFPSSFFSKYFVNIYMVHLYTSIDTSRTWNNFHFFSPCWNKISIWSITCQQLSTCLLRHMLASLLIDEILLPKYMNLSPNFRGLPLKVKMAHSCLKYINSI